MWLGYKHDDSRQMKTIGERASTQMTNLVQINVLLFKEAMDAPKNSIKIL